MRTKTERIVKKNRKNSNGSWTTFRGMVYQLKLLNKRYKKMGVKATYTVTLPLKD